MATVVQNVVCLSKMKIKCHNCGNEKFSEKKVEEVFNIDGKIYFIKNIQALVCDRCEEKYFTPDVHREIFKLINNQDLIKGRIETEVYEMA
jgi:YgiT-type zinc finger domain-containing protein